MRILACELCLIIPQKSSVVDPLFLSTSFCAAAISTSWPREFDLCLPLGNMLIVVRREHSLLSHSFSSCFPNGDAYVTIELILQAITRRRICSRSRSRCLIDLHRQASSPDVVRHRSNGDVQVQLRVENAGLGFSPRSRRL